MNSATQTTKILAASIRVIWTEGGETPEPFTNFAAFDAWARAIGCPDPGGMSYYKTKFVITWADGQEYTGRMDLDSECMANPANILATHILRYLDYQAIAGSAQEQAEAMAYAALYTIGDAGAESSDVANNDNGSPVAALLLAMATSTRARGAPEPPAPLFCGAKHDFCGAKHDGARPLRETATLIRKELAAAGKAATGPLAGCVCRVKIDRSNTSRSIDVWIDSVPAKGMTVLNPAYIEADEAGQWPLPSRLSKRGEAMVKAASEIVNAYNRDITSERPHFYGDVSFGADLVEATRAEILATLALLKQA